MKILIFTDTLGGGGKERRIGELLRGLKDNTEFQFEIAVLDEKVSYSVFNELPFPIHFIKRKSKYDLSMFREFYRLCRMIQPDIVQTWDSFSSLVALPTVKLQKIRFINNFITVAPPSLKLTSRNYIYGKISVLFSNLIVANSYAGLRSFNVPVKKGRVIVNGFDISRVSSLIAKEETKQQYGITTEKAVVMVASFTKQKDFDTYLSSAAHIVAMREDVTFLAVGDGPFMNDCMRKYRHERIKFLGRISNVESIVNICDIGVLLSNFGEGISNSLLEYMALGKPVIATNCGGNIEVISDEISGYLIPEKNGELLSEKILFLLNNPGSALSMGRSGNEIVKNKFSYELFLINYSSLFHEVMNTRLKNI